MAMTDTPVPARTPLMVTPADVRRGDVVRFLPKRFKRRVTVHLERDPFLSPHFGDFIVKGFRCRVDNGVTITRGEYPLDYFVRADERVELVKAAS